MKHPLHPNCPPRETWPNPYCPPVGCCCQCGGPVSVCHGVAAAHCSPECQSLTDEECYDHLELLSRHTHPSPSKADWDDFSAHVPVV